jgi:hypothetical protein
MCLFPELTRNAKGVDFKFVPPCNFIAGLVQLPVMATAERYCKLVADLNAECPRVGKAQMMGVAGLPAADNTRLRGDEAKVGFIAPSLWFR